MGELVKIVDFVKCMIYFMGMKEFCDGRSDEGDIEIKFIGLCLGEKFYEELFIGENVEGISY